MKQLASFVLSCHFCRVRERFNSIPILPNSSFWAFFAIHCPAKLRHHFKRLKEIYLQGNINNNVEKHGIDLINKKKAIMVLIKENMAAVQYCRVVGVSQSQRNVLCKTLDTITGSSKPITTVSKHEISLSFYKAISEQLESSSFIES